MAIGTSAKMPEEPDAWQRSRAEHERQENELARRKVRRRTEYFDRLSAAEKELFEREEADPYLGVHNVAMAIRSTAEYSKTISRLSWALVVLAVVLAALTAVLLVRTFVPGHSMLHQLSGRAGAPKGYGSGGYTFRFPPDIIAREGADYVRLIIQ